MIYLAYAIISISSALIRAGHAGEALRHDRHTLSLDPNFAQAHYSLSNTLRQAIVHYRKELALQPDYAKARHNIEILFYMLAEN